jgi:hypothetical protein
MAVRTKLVLAIIFILALTVTAYGYFSSIAVAEAVIQLEIAFLLNPSELASPAGLGISSSAGLEVEESFLPASSSALEASGIPLSAQHLIRLETEGFNER